MYVLAKNNSIVALDAATGKELWLTRTARGTHHARTASTTGRARTARIAGCCTRTTACSRPSTRRPARAIPSFGANGIVDLREGLGRDPAKISVQSPTPGRVFENLIILGSATNQEYDSAPGDIRAYDVRSGKLVVDLPHHPARGRIRLRHVAEGRVEDGRRRECLGRDVRSTRSAASSTSRPRSPKYNFYGANRKGANLFGDCLLALDARTGKRLWHFQMVHHDIWDYDNATAPKLLTVRHDGKTVDVVAQAGKTGLPLRLRSRDRRAALADRRAAGAPQPTCPAKRPGRRSRSRPRRRRSRGRDSPRTISARSSTIPRSARASSTTFAARGTKACSRRPGFGPRSRCRATTAARTSGAPPSIRSTAR